MSKSGFIAAVAALVLVWQPGQAAPVANARWAALAHRLFPALEALPLDRIDPEARAVLAARRLRIDACQQVVECVLEVSRWTNAESSAVAADATKLLAGMESSDAVPDDGPRAQLMREFRGLNNIISVYGLGAKPLYPDIDGPNPAMSARQAARTLKYAVELAGVARDDPVTRLDPSIALGLALLDVNDRDDAIAFESLDARYNAGAVAKAKTLGRGWERYRFTAIIVPGRGPDDLSTPLSPGGKLRIRLAAQAFAEGLAPFIIVSGGMVHPRGTHFAEAIQMRRALLEDYGIPVDRIVVDPYARHTTTNLRNATRRLMALGAPLDRDALIVSDPEQIRYIKSREFANLNLRVLGYEPGTVGNQLSPFELTFRPARASMRVDPMDPLDP
ncbi:MAG TPA: YdcF family protein [Steroidobacteraceae bacterium]|nr:YdcF family protein [Steroidobacteraceae bacterium]